jgi:multidrug resistance efflux pump
MTGSGSGCRHSAGRRRRATALAGCKTKYKQALKRKRAHQALTNSGQESPEEEVQEMQEEGEPAAGLT